MKQQTEALAAIGKASEAAKQAEIQRVHALGVKVEEDVPETKPGAEGTQIR